MLPLLNRTGIAGILARRHDAADETVRRMLRALSHRGPDVARSFACGRDLSMGYVGQAYSEESLAAACAMEDGETPSLVFDGFIGNADDIADRLQAEGVAVGRASPQQVLLAALETWGSDALSCLHGFFALAYYDAAKRMVLIARDALGVRPLYIGETMDGGWAFASEIRAIFATGLVSREHEANGIAEFLAFGHACAPRTIHRFVRELPAGHMQWLDADWTARLPPDPQRYWQVPTVNRDLAGQAATDALGHALQEAVTDVVKGVPAVSVHLPGNTESALVAQLARRSCADLRTALVEIESDGYEEHARLAAAVASQLETRHFQMIIDHEWGASLWREWLSASDSPCVEGYGIYVNSEAIRSTGSVVALDPTGGSELLRGFPIAGQIRQLLALRRRIDRSPRWLRPALVSQVVAGASPSCRDVIRWTVTGASSLSDVALTVRRIFFNVELAAMGLPGVDSGAVADRVSAGSPIPFGGDGDDPAETLQRLQSLLWLPNREARACNVNGMANSLDLRLPYLDRRFVEAVTRTPGVISCSTSSHGYARLLRLSEFILPLNLLHRREPPPAFPLVSWITGPLLDYCTSCIESAARCTALDGSAMRDRWRRFIADPRLESTDKIVALLALGAAEQQLQAVSPVAGQGN